jgi:TIR domain
VQLFISHSAQTPRARAVLAAVRSRLEKLGHEVFVDADILAGAEWRSVLYHHLAICQGAVVLLDASTVDKRWVQREVDLLLWRRAFNRNVVILPVILDETHPGAVRARGFGELTETQFICAGRRRLGPRQIADQVAETFATAPTAPATCMEQWFDDIEVVLERIGHPHKLRLAALALGVDSDSADQVLQHGGYRFLAHQFLGRATDDAAVAAIKQLLYCTDTDTLGKLVTLISPTWVDAAASRPLVLHGPDDRYVAVLNARDPRTAEQYCHRATCLDALARAEYVSTMVGEFGVTELVQECEKAVKLLLGGEVWDSWDDLLPAWIQDGPRTKDGARLPRFLIVDATEPLTKQVVAEAVGRIRERFRWLIVIVMVGKTAPTSEEIAAWRLADARILEPALGPTAEVEARSTMRQLFHMLEIAGGRRWR